jgi:hypothetical protein
VGTRHPCSIRVSSVAAPRLAEPAGMKAVAETEKLFDNLSAALRLFRTLSRQRPSHSPSISISGSTSPFLSNRAMSISVARLWPSSVRLVAGVSER